MGRKVRKMETSSQRRSRAVPVPAFHIDPPFNSNRNYEVFRGDQSEPERQRAGILRGFDRHAATATYIDFMHPRCVELARVLKKTGSFYYRCGWRASKLRVTVSDGARREPCL
jgi:DNA modification methylase